MNSRTVYRTLLLGLAMWLSAAARSTAIACSCAGLPSVEAARHAADAVFVGTVVSHRAPEPYPISETDTTRIQSSGDFVRYVLVIREIWKGDIADTMVVYSRRDGSSCGFVMERGREYLLYARLQRSEPGAVAASMEVWPEGRPSSPYLTVGSCTRNHLVSNADGDHTILGEPIWRRSRERH